MFPLLSTSVIAKLFARFGSAFFLTFHCCCFISFRPFSILRWSYVLFAGLQWCFHGTHEELGLAKGRSKYTDFRHYTTVYGHTHTTHGYAPTHFTKIHNRPDIQTAQRPQNASFFYFESDVRYIGGKFAEFGLPSSCTPDEFRLYF